MPPSRPRQPELVLHCEAPPPGFVPRLLAGQKLVERNWPVLRPEATRRAEIGDAAFGGDARPREWQDDGSLRDCIREPFDRAAEIRNVHRFDPLFLPISRRPT